MSRCTIIGIVIAKPEKREELLAILAAQVAPTRAEPACLNYDFHVDAEDPNKFMFYENWRSRADLETHLRMPHLKPLQSRLDELLARPVEIRFYEMLSAVAG
jgi:quinol monooxygenase YgiN